MKSVASDTGPFMWPPSAGVGDATAQLNVAVGEPYATAEDQSLVVEGQCVAARGFAVPEQCSAAVNNRAAAVTVEQRSGVVKQRRAVSEQRARLVDVCRVMEEGIEKGDEERKVAHEKVVLVRDTNKDEKLGSNGIREEMGGMMEEGADGKAEGIEVAEGEAKVGAIAVEEVCDAVAAGDKPVWAKGVGVIDGSGGAVAIGDSDARGVDLLRVVAGMDGAANAELNMGAGTALGLELTRGQTGIVLEGMARSEEVMEAEANLNGDMEIKHVEDTDEANAEGNEDSAAGSEYVPEMDDDYGGDLFFVDRKGDAAVEDVAQRDEVEVQNDMNSGKFIFETGAGTARRRRSAKREREPAESEDVIVVEDDDSNADDVRVVKEELRASSSKHEQSSHALAASDPRLEQLQRRVEDAKRTVHQRQQLYNEAVAELQGLESTLALRQIELRQAADAAFDWDQTAFPWVDILTRELRNVFRIQSFRPLQREALNATLLGRDVFAIMPTGAGKSLVYQLAAVVDRGLTLVITPLLSLSMDQKAALHALNIRAESLDSTTRKEVRQNIYKSVLPIKTKSRKLSRVVKRRRRVASTPDERSTADWRQDTMETTILFVTPEQVVRSGRLMGRIESLYEAGHLSRIVVDEAHCCSLWGHDFRADYKKLGLLKRQCLDTPVLALSATANEETVTDVRKILEIPRCVVFRGSTDRPNLHYEVRKKKDDDEGVVVDIAFMLLNEFKGKCGIVYVLSRREAEDYSQRLQAMDIAAGAYHGDMLREERDAVQEGWQSGELQVVIATTAFGLGIDNQRVRFVVHATMASSLEAYYQESGRAGRNGQAAKCILMHRPKDFTRMSNFVADKGPERLAKLYDMYRYASGRDIGGRRDQRATCRRRVIAASFGEEPPARTPQQRRRCCDVCARDTIPSATPATVAVDVGDAARSVQQIVQRYTARRSEKVTLLAAATMWGGKGVKAQEFRGDEAAPSKRLVLNVRLEILIGLVLCGGLREYHRHNAHATNAYVVGGGTELEKGQTFTIVLHAEDAKGLPGGSGVL